LVYQSKSLTFLLLLVALFAGVVSFQSDGGRWGDIARNFRLEAHDDSIAVHEDATMLRDVAKSLPIEAQMMWASLRYHVTTLHASAKAETKVVATYLPRPKDW
jgi:hypothetical protein